MSRNVHAFARLYSLCGGVNGGLCRVGLGSSGKQERCVCKRNLRLWHAEFLCRFAAGAYDRCRQGVGKTDVLGCDDLQPAADCKKLARKERLGKVEHRGIGVGAANGFLQAGEQIVVRIVIKIANGCVKAVYVLTQNLIVGGVVSVLKKHHRVADVTARRVPDIIANFIRNALTCAIFFVQIVQCATQNGAHIGGRDSLELKQRGTRKDRVVNKKVRVFGGGCDQRDAAILNVFQKGLLLLAVEILDLIQIEQNAV